MNRLPGRMRTFILMAYGVIGLCAQTHAGLTVEALGTRYAPDPARAVIRQPRADAGGSTSIRNTSREHLEWKRHGYYQRNRDLGQVFTAERDFTLAAVVLRTGPSDAAVLAGTPGAPLFIQFFEVEGEPRIDDSGTPPGTDASHGFSKNHRCDDVIRGVTYRPLHTVSGGRFPDLTPSRDLSGKATGSKSSCGVYLRWSLDAPSRLACRAGKRYAFVVGIEEPGRERGFTLANANAASVNAPPSLTDRHDPYPGGWGLRREGDGTLPPATAPADLPPEDPERLAVFLREALFPEGAVRFHLPPTTDGYPDVDTYRDLEFTIEAADTASQPAATVSGPVVMLDYTGQAANDIPIADFLYFVPLISPEPVTVSESATNTLRVRVASIRQDVRSDRFHLNLAFDISGQGFRLYAIDQSENLRRHERHLAAGQALKKQLDYIRYEGPAKGRVEIGGRIENGVKTVTTVCLHFDDRGGASPVTVGLKDVRLDHGALTFENELVARVSLLEFTRDGAPPRMGVRINSVKRRQAGDNFYQNLKGRFVGMVANVLVESISIRKLGNDTLLNFGQAVLERKPSFTFPVAENLRTHP